MPLDYRSLFCLRSPTALASETILSLWSLVPYCLLTVLFILWQQYLPGLTFPGLSQGGNIPAARTPDLSQDLPGVTGKSKDTQHCYRYPPPFHSKHNCQNYGNHLTLIFEVPGFTRRPEKQKY